MTRLELDILRAVRDNPGSTREEIRTLASLEHLCGSTCYQNLRRLEYDGLLDSYSDTAEHSGKGRPPLRYVMRKKGTEALLASQAKGARP